MPTDQQTKILKVCRYERVVAHKREPGDLEKLMCYILRSAIIGHTLTFRALDTFKRDSPILYDNVADQLANCFVHFEKFKIEESKAALFITGMHLLF